MKNQQMLGELLYRMDEVHCPANAHPEAVPPYDDTRPRKRNVIWIVTDQQRACSLGCNGDPNARTPNLDVMARFGINFPQAVSTYPLCSPFRGTMLTGNRHNACVPGHCYMMPPDQRTVADILNDNGYDTAFFGKWHVDGCRTFGALHTIPYERRGRFNRWLGYENNDTQWNTWVHGHDKNQQEIPMFKLKGFEADSMTDYFIDYLKERSENPEQPFFAVLSVFPPHSPYVAPAEQTKHYQWHDMILRDNVPHEPAFQQQTKQDTALYSAMVENIDHNVGRIVQTLRECELDLDTHIMFFSDHGDMLGSHGLSGKVVPYEESVRIPFIIGGAVPAHCGYRTGKSDALITDLDIVPTTLGLCGVPVPEDLPGYDYSYLRYSPDQAEYEERKKQEPQCAFAESIIPREGCEKAWRSVMTRDGWKYVCFEDAEWLMFDLNTDPYEEHNLAHANYLAGKRRYLHGLLKTHLEEIHDAFRLPDSRFFG